MQYEAYWGMEMNPFQKNIDEKYSYQSNDFKQIIGRLEHLKKIKGIGLFTGSSGTGKSFGIRCFSSKLNQNLFKVVYIALSTVTVLEFYKSLALGLGLEPLCKKVDLYKSIQDRIITLVSNKKTTPLIIIDEAQYLKTEVLNDIKLLLNFKMDSVNNVIFVLSGQPVLNNILSKNIHDALKQRILINYNADGLSLDETKDYINSRLKLAGVHDPVFNDNTYEAIYSCANTSVRRLNHLVEKCLLIGAKESIKEIDTNIVMLAQNEIELFS